MLSMIFVVVLLHLRSGDVVLLATDQKLNPGDELAPSDVEGSDQSNDIFGVSTIYEQCGV